MILDGYEGGFYHSREVPMAHLQSVSLQKEAPGSIVLEEGGEFKNSLVCSSSTLSKGTLIGTRQAPVSVRLPSRRWAGFSAGAEELGSAPVHGD